MARKTNIYFEDFNRMAEYARRAAEYLQGVLRDYDTERLSEHRKAMHEIENGADKVKHELNRRLAREFITPIDREDILEMALELDTVTDKIEDVLIRLYMYNVRAIHPAALTLSDVILRCCGALVTAMAEFHNFHKSTELRRCIIDVNTMEDEGDKLYIQSVRSLYESGTDSLETRVWSKLFDCLEDCCDACEHVADTMDVIVIKNS